MVETQQVSNMIQTQSLLDTMGLTERGKYMSPKKWNEKVIADAYGPGREFNIRIESHGSIVDVEQTYLEAIITLTGDPQSDYLFHNYLQFVTGVNLRVGNHDLKYKPENSALLIACIQKDFREWRQKLGLNRDANIQFQATAAAQENLQRQTPTHAYIQQLNAIPGILFPVRIPLKCLFPEICQKGYGGALWVDNQSSVQMTFKVGQADCLINKTKNTASTIKLSTISQIRLVYKESYPLKDQMNMIRAQTFETWVPFYDVQQSSQTSGQFNFSLQNNESYKKIYLAGVFSQSLARKTANADLHAQVFADTYANLLSQTVADGSQLHALVNGCTLPLEMDVAVNFPGHGKQNLTRNSLISMHILENHYDTMGDQIFKWVACIDLRELPYDEKLDESLVHYSEVQNPQQLTINYRIITSSAGNASVPFYAGVGPANLGVTQNENGVDVMCVLEAEKKFLIKNGAYDSP